MSLFTQYPEPNYELVKTLALKQTWFCNWECESLNNRVELPMEKLVFHHDTEWGYSSLGPIWRATTCITCPECKEEIPLIEGIWYMDGYVGIWNEQTCELIQTSGRHPLGH